MGSVHEVIEAFRKAPSNSERGTKFEKLMVHYFELDPMLAQQYDAVWRWIDWPDRNGKPDLGIDLVARERDSGEYTAIQCKFYEPTHTLAKDDINSFFAESGKKPFTNRIIISTTDKWGPHAESTLADQTIPVQRIGLAEIAASPIDWDVTVEADLEVAIAPAKRNELRPHQREAINDVFTGFAAGHDRGKLIMACGTGKTFTSLKIAERTVTDNGGTARILFAVPSISLLSQTLREWTAQTQLPLRAFAVCSDAKVSRTAEDVSVHDVAIPVTTDPAKLAAEIAAANQDGLMVVFTTYQSLPVVAAAQAKGGVAPFDLVICDEAHRTTGVTLFGEDESAFVRVHDGDYLKATRRLYMTATPRIFDEKVKDKALEASAETASMDDEDKFGPEFHRLSFGKAVGHGLLCDYKVIVLTVDTSVMAGAMQQQLAQQHAELELDDASKIVGCWNGLAKRAGSAPDGTGFPPGAAPMRRAVAFAKDIAASKQVRDVFPAVVDAYRDLIAGNDEGNNFDLACQVRHVDGTMNALHRNSELQWLKAPIPDGEARILTNARCLSEGVDVPALDAVMFLHPRNSVVDVVQSVGRVMRRADSEGKQYGYIILPVAVPAGVSPASALDNNQRFKVVWQVLNALRAHDERFNAMVNSIALNTVSKTDQKLGKGNNQLLGGHIGPTKSDEGLDDGSGKATDNSESTEQQLAKQLLLFSLSDWQEAIYAKIVDKVGTRKYWDQWAADVADIADALITRINAILATADTDTQTAFETFLTGLRDNLNDSISRDDAISMLAQHLITLPVFDALFAGHEFANYNPVSLVMQSMVEQLHDSGLQAETNKLSDFYDSVRTRASEVTTADGKQKVIAELYEKFFRIGFKKQADALGIVYTPVEVVDFILRAADQASRDAFGRSLSDKDVHILDPFTGTGTFMTRLLQSGLINPTDLARKYLHELHANEIMLLAYYIAAVNIETTFHALTNAATYQPFQGIVLTDTFQITEDGDSMDTVMFPQNNDRIVRQMEIPINIVMANPPYSVGQDAANDLNANLKYPTLDGRIAKTYAARSTATNKNSLYDSYLRAFRWATDRVGDNGVVAFVSNGGWVDGNTADGIRLSLANEYARIYVYNLRGNQRTAGELSRKEGGKIFGSGSRNTVAIFIGVRSSTHVGPCEVLYRDIGDYLTREEKLAIVDKATLATVDWQPVTPNVHGDWVTQRNDEYLAWPVIGDKNAGLRVFETYSRGLATARDSWCYGSSQAAVALNMRRMIDFYNAQVDGYADYCAKHGITDRKSNVDKFIDTDPTKISWNRGTKHDLALGKRYAFRTEAIVEGSYRPFHRQYVYFDRQLNDMVYQLPSLFPTPHHTNFGFYVVGAGSDKPFSTVMTDQVPDLSFWGSGSGQFFPRWTYERSELSSGFDFGGTAETDKWGYRKIDNITDAIHKLYIDAIGEVSKDDIFYYVYGLLHDPDYRQAYAADLKKMLPHIPTPTSRNRFNQLAQAGRKLADLHVDYEAVEPYPLDLQVKGDPADRETWRVQKMRWKTKGDFTTIVYNPRVMITGIPTEAERYQLGSRSALAWIIDRYQVKTDKASGIVNDPNDWCDEHENFRYIVDLIAKVTTVAIETVKIVEALTVEPEN